MPPSEPNQTSMERAMSAAMKYAGRGGWAKDSGSPECGWPMAILGAVAVIAVCAGVAMIGAAVGFN